MVRVGVNGYGTIGKRVADAVRAQPDMDVVGVAKRSMDAGARTAVAAGFPLYSPEQEPGAERADDGSADVPVVGTVEDLVAESDVVVDATPGGVGAEYAPMYEAHDTPAIFQGAESPDVAETSFTARTNFESAVGAETVRVVSCNTTGLARLLTPIDETFGVERVRATLVRRGGDPAQHDRGPIDDILPDPITVPSHHGTDLQTVMPELDVDTMGVTVPATRMHLHAVNVTLDGDPDAETVRSLLASEPRLFLVPDAFDVDSCGGLKELAKDAGRPRGDVWENCIWEDSVAVRDGELFCFQAIHQEADVVPENVDAIRAVEDLVSADCSRSMTNQALGLGDRPGATVERQQSPKTAGD